MIRPILFSLALIVPAVSSAQTTFIPPGSKLFVPTSEFGMALSAALMKKHVPITVVIDKEQAGFWLEATSTSNKEGQGERVAKVIAFGAFAGSGKSVEGSVAVTTPSGDMVFAHSAKKDSMKSAAENVAKALADHIKEGEKQRNRPQKD